MIFVRDRDYYSPENLSYTEAEEQKGNIGIKNLNLSSHSCEITLKISVHISKTLKSYAHFELFCHKLED